MQGEVREVESKMLSFIIYELEAFVQDFAMLFLINVPFR